MVVIMPKFIKTDKAQDNVFLPISLSKQIQKGTFEYTLVYLIDHKIDMTSFYEIYKNDETGRYAWNPKLLLKIILFAYSRGAFTSRKIIQMCRENITMIAIAENSVPDFTVIANFISTMGDKIHKLFVCVLLACDNLGLLGHTQFALDGCKMSSNASKEYSGKFSDFKKKIDKLNIKLEYLIETHRKSDKQDIDEEEKNQGLDYDKRIQNAAKKIRSKIRKIENFLENAEPKKGARGNEIKSNITDNESAKMKTSHGVLQGYNGQAMVDDKHQIIISAEAFGDGQDSGNFKPMIENTLTNMKEIGKDENYLEDKILIADTGYNSEDNLRTAEHYKTDAYIPDQQFRKRDPRFADKDRFIPNRKDESGVIKKSDFMYNEENNTYACPGGKILKQYGMPFKIKDWTYKRYTALKSDCSQCNLRDDCLKTEKTKCRSLLFQIKSDNRNHSLAMVKKMCNVEALDIYSKRMQIVEPVFANIRHQKKLSRFTLRGKIKVNIQWNLYTLVHNIEKIANFGDLSLIAG